MLFVLNLKAQTTILEANSKTTSTISTQELAQYNKIAAYDLYSDHYFVDFGSLASTQSGGKIRIDLPGDPCGSLIFKAKEVQYTSESDYEWYGVLESTADDEDCYCKLGSVQLISTDDGKIGHFKIDDLVYEMQSLSESTFLISKLDKSKFTNSECQEIVDTSEIIDGPKEILNRQNGNCDVRCLVVFTRNALIAEGSVEAIRNRARLAVTQTNIALRNSAVTSSQLRIILSDVLPIDFEESTNIIDDLTDLTDEAEPQTLRDNTESDIVIVLTNGPYGQNVRGAAFRNLVDEDAYGVVQVGPSTTGFFTFAHEVAHIFGGRHELIGVASGINFAHKFKSGDFLPCIFGASQRTILHTANEVDDRIQHYSNPNVKFNGTETGTSTRNNAQHMRNTACTVAGFRISEEAFRAGIVGDSYMCPCGIADVSVVVYGGTAGVTYTYQWSASQDGINWTNLGIGPSAIGVSVPCEEGEGIFVRCLVTGSNATTFLTNSGFIEAAMTWPDQEGPCMLQRPVANTTFNENISATPNPARGAFKLNINFPAESQYSISVVDIQGKIVSSIAHNAYFDKGIHHFDVSLIESGLYFIYCISAEGELMYSKVINH